MKDKYIETDVTACSLTERLQNTVFGKKGVTIGVRMCVPCGSGVRCRPMGGDRLQAGWTTKGWISPQGGAIYVHPLLSTALTPERHLILIYSTSSMHCVQTPEEHLSVMYIKYCVHCLHLRDT